jgi:hypothetical protein
MFQINCSDNFFKSHLEKVLVQKKSYFTFDNKKKYFDIINIDNNNDQIIVFTNNNKIKCNLPITFDKFFKLLINISSKIKIKLKCLEYFPINQNIVKDKKILKLNDIHFLIFNQLLLNIDDGVDKHEMYKILWPSDKNILVNKIDTHLSNLKNLLLRKFDENLYFTTHQGKIKLIVD